MNTNHLQKLILAGLLLCCCLLSGCFHIASAVVRHIGTTRENISPKTIFSLEDGTIAVEVVSSFYREGTFDYHKKIPSNRYAARERYVLLDSTFIQKEIDSTWNWDERNINIRDVVIFGSPSAHPSGGAPGILPISLFDPDVNSCSPPDWFDLNGAKRYDLKESVPYRLGNRDVYLNFTETRFVSHRVKKSWWVGPAKVPAMILDVPLGVVAMFMPLTMMRNIDDEFSI